MALLAVEKLVAGYGPIDALHELSLEVNPGEIVALIGANGAGKTTTLMSISGLVRVRRGKVHFQKQDITRVPAHRIVKSGLVQSPEGRKIFPRMSVLENLEMGAFTRSDSAGIR
ncbi:MAG: ATP-binding cassette domain-containing protein, partial [Gemmataceae bacterium]